MTPFLRQLELRRDEVPSWDQYPFSIPAVRTLEELRFTSPCTFLVGENGCGKSTLIEAIAIKAGFNAEGGTKHFRTQLRPSESDLHSYLRIVREPRRERSGFFLRAETMFNVSTEAEGYGDYGWERLHERSHGEAFLWVVLNRFRPRGLYILDEPEAALSPQRQLTLLARMHDLIQAGSQFIVSTHSPLLMAYPGAQILLLTTSGIEPTRLEDTEHYQVTRSVLANPEATFRTLFGDDQG